MSGIRSERFFIHKERYTDDRDWPYLQQQQCFLKTCNFLRWYIVCTQHIISCIVVRRQNGSVHVRAPRFLPLSSPRRSLLYTHTLVIAFEKKISIVYSVYSPFVFVPSSLSLSHRLDPVPVHTHADRNAPARMLHVWSMVIITRGRKGRKRLLRS